jgi:hypothetical protein
VGAEEVAGVAEVAAEAEAGEAEGVAVAVVAAEREGVEMAQGVLEVAVTVGADLAADGLAVVALVEVETAEVVAQMEGQCTGTR